MARSTKMFFEQPNLSMPSSVWLHINGVSVTTDVQPYQPPVHSYDYRTKHLQSPVPPPTPPSTFVPCSITMIDGLYINNNMNKQYQKLENTDLPKKFFIDRQIKKAKSLPGLIKGTALSHHTPLQSSTFTGSSLVNPSTNTIQDDQLPMATVDNDDDSPSIPKTIDHQTEIRRPRVYFADFNKIQFLDDKTETSQQHQTPPHCTRRRHRRRLTKKTSDPNAINHISPSIQQTQILQNVSRPLSHKPNHQTTQELNIRKQQLLASPRIHSSRITHLPDIPNQSLANEPLSNENFNEKYTLLREKPLNRLLKSFIEIPTASSTDILSDDTHTGIGRSSPKQDSHIQIYESESGESPSGTFLNHSPTISSISINRQRPSLRSISLRQQFISPAKLKPTTNNNQSNNSLSNTRRSASLKQTSSRMHDDNDDLHPTNGSFLTTENRPMTSTRSNKQLKRSDIIHFNSKNPLAANSTNDSNKSTSYDPKQERFQNILTIVRPPYATGNGTSNISSINPNNSTIQSINPNHSMANYRSSRSISARGALGFHVTSNTIIV